MESKLVYRNSNGVKRTLVSDDVDPKVVRVYTEVQMDEVLESVKRAREAEDALNFPVNRMLARVPMTVYEQSLLEQWDEDRWKAWLNDPDNAHFRIWRGRV